MEFQEAKLLAVEKLEVVQKLIGIDLVLIGEEPHKSGDGWLFFYNTKISVETCNPLDGLTGNGPIHVSSTGIVTEHGGLYSF